MLLMLLMLVILLMDQVMVSMMVVIVRTLMLVSGTSHKQEAAQCHEGHSCYGDGAPGSVLPG